MDALKRTYYNHVIGVLTICCLSFMTGYAQNTRGDRPSPPPFEPLKRDHPTQPKKIKKKTYKTSPKRSIETRGARRQAEPSGARPSSGYPTPPTATRSPTGRPRPEYSNEGAVKRLREKQALNRERAKARVANQKQLSILRQKRERYHRYKLDAVRYATSLKSRYTSRIDAVQKRERSVGIFNVFSSRDKSQNNYAPKNLSTFKRALPRNRASTAAASRRRNVIFGKNYQTNPTRGNYKGGTARTSGGRRRVESGRPSLGSGISAIDRYQRAGNLDKRGKTSSKKGLIASNRRGFARRNATVAGTSDFRRTNPKDISGGRLGSKRFGPYSKEYRNNPTYRGGIGGSPQTSEKAANGEGYVGGIGIKATTQYREAGNLDKRGKTSPKKGIVGKRQLFGGLDNVTGGQLYYKRRSIFKTQQQSVTRYKDLFINGNHSRGGAITTDLAGFPLRRKNFRSASLTFEGYKTGVNITFRNANIPFSKPLPRRLYGKAEGKLSATGLKERASFQGSGNVQDEFYSHALPKKQYGKAEGSLRGDLSKRSSLLRMGKYPILVKVERKHSPVDFNRSPTSEKPYVGGPLIKKTYSGLAKKSFWSVLFGRGKLKYDKKEKALWKDLYD